MNDIAIHALLGVTTTVVGVLFFFGPWQRLVVDQTRQRLFEIRDTWFDLSVGLESEHDRAIARRFRQNLNGFLHTAEDMTLTMLIGYLLTAYLRKRRNASAAAAEDSPVLRGMSDRVIADRGDELTKLATQQVLWGMLRRSPWLVVVLAAAPFVLLAAIVILTAGGLRNAHQTALDRLLSAVSGASGFDPEGFHPERDSAQRA